jgi:hypothetical protein
MTAERSLAKFAPLTAFEQNKRRQPHRDRFQVLVPKDRAVRLVPDGFSAEDPSGLLAMQVSRSIADAYLDFGSVMTSSTQSSPLKSWFVFLQRVAGKPLRPSDEPFLAPSLLLERLVLGGFAGKTCVELSTLPRGVRVGLWVDDEEEAEDEDEDEDEELLRVLVASAIVDRYCGVLLNKSLVITAGTLPVLSMFRSDPLVRS